MATPPRRYLPGTIWFATSRCLERRFFLRPDSSVNQAILYALAHYAKKYGIRIHSFACPSNHYHMIFTDTRGEADRFLRSLNSILGRCINCYRGRNDHFFCAQEPSMVELPRTPEDLIERSAYVILNLVEAGLVSHAKKWPGVVTLPHEIGVRRITVDRPDFFFDPDGEMPDQVVFETFAPEFPDAPHMDADAFRKALSETVNRRQRRKQETMKAAGRTFVGAKRVLRQSWNSCPKTPDGFRTLNPRAAALDARVRQAMLDSNKVYRLLHSVARQAVKEPDTDRNRIVFPAGTVQAVHDYAFSCADPPKHPHWLPYLRDP